MVVSPALHLGPAWTRKGRDGEYWVVGRRKGGRGSDCNKGERGMKERLVMNRRN